MEMERRLESIPPLLNMRRVDAARYLREVHGIPCAPATLAKLAVIGGGPPYRKFGKFPIYARDDLDAWASEHLSHRLTSSSDSKSHVY